MEKDINEYLRRLSTDTELGDSMTTPSTIPVETNGNWIGKVVDNQDPLYLGRCRVRVFGHYDDIDLKAIPWAVYQSNYVGGTYSNFIVPELGSIVTGFFENGDTQKPVYTGTVTTTDSMTKSVTSVSRVTDYPDTMVLMETDQGESLTLNRKTGKLTFTHRSGMSVNIAANGSIDITQAASNSNLDDTTPATLTVNIADSANITVNGDVSIDSKMNVNIEAAGEIRLGNNPAKQLLCNLPNCLVTGAPHAVGNVQVKA